MVPLPPSLPQLALAMKMGEGFTGSAQRPVRVVVIDASGLLSIIGVDFQPTLTSRQTLHHPAGLLGHRLIIGASRFSSIRTMAAPSFSRDDSALISSLITLSKSSPKLVKWSDYPAPADPKITVRSWKMNEFKYYDIPSPFPTLARGLFSRQLPGGEEGEARYCIVARGYDKFFNIGEVPWTTWPSLEAHTAAPYTMTLKSNGCIIFIAALTPSKILVTSKHSVGPVAGSSKSHAEAGEVWLRKYIDAKGKTEEDFASALWEKNITAIAELCDDSFEEHVLPYPPESTGLHLHGLNRSSAAFDTLDQSEVDAFAQEWGFIQTRSIVLSSITEVQEFSNEVGKTGKWEGEAVEGFVVRCRVRDPPTDSSNKNRPDKSPYSPGSSFFFKIKFDEPYMMYRDWREITKMMISTLTTTSKNKPGLSIAASTKTILAKLPKTRMKRPETRKYAEWVCEELKTEMRANGGKLGPNFALYNSGKGIIATRERFLASLREKGESLETVAVEENEPKEFGKTVIVPIAIPGCGKTAVSVALTHIFGFGHTQSDDIKVKKPAPHFLKNVVDLLDTNDVVIADKNNHLRQHREQLREATAVIDPSVRLLALDWNHVLFPTPTPSNPSPISLPAIHRLASTRILGRGTNHQSLIADNTPQREHEDVLWMFIGAAEDLADGECDAVIDMDIEEGLEKAIERAVDGICKELKLDRPPREKILEGLEKAKGYVPVMTKKVDEAEKTKGKKKSSSRYFAILPEIDLVSLVSQGLEVGGAAKGGETFWKELVKNNRVTKRPHITITHKKSLPEEQSVWDVCSALDQLSPVKRPLFWIRFNHVVWDGRVMALVVDDFGPQEGNGDGGLPDEAKRFMDSMQGDVKERLHVTVGTLDDSVPPVEAKDLVAAWKRGSNASPGLGAGEIGHLPLAGDGRGIVVVGQLRGMY